MNKNRRQILTAVVVGAITSTNSEISAAESSSQMKMPWVACAQTKVAANSVVLNPATHRNGLLGEADLPYVVPDGKILHIKQIQLEGLWGQSIILYIGDSESKTEVTPLGICLPTYATPSSDPSTNPTQHLVGSRVFETDFYLPAGKKLNVRLSVNDNPGPGDNWIYGWGVFGELLDA